MEDAKQTSNPPGSVAPSDAIAGANLLWFGLHLAAVYIIVYYLTAWLGGRYYDWILPIVDPGNRTSSFQFIFSHLFEFTFLPAFVAGFANSQFRRRPAIYVWIVPTIILGYKLFTFPTTVFQNHFQVAFDHYFSRHFLIGEFHNFQELFTVVAGNPDAVRGLDQEHFTGPFYAGLGYSLAALIAGRVQISALKRAFSRPDLETPGQAEDDRSNLENTADTMYPAAPDGSPRRE